MNILHIGTADNDGGAARAAFRLHLGLINLGHSSHMVVGYRVEDRSEIDTIPKRKTFLQKIIYQRTNYVEKKTGLQYLLLPWKNEFIRHRFTRQANIINLHNIHGGFFSHTILPQLSQMAPIVWTLHDQWSMTGHCSYPGMFKCEQWKTRCGKCNALFDYPPLSRDTTSLLWRIKNWVYKNSNITIVAPSEWMAKMARESSLLNRFKIHCVPYGLDVNIFKPIQKLDARKVLNLPPNSKVILFSAFDFKYPRKGGMYLLKALQCLSGRKIRSLLLLIVGSNQMNINEKDYGFPIHNLGLIKDDHLMATCYSAADVYVGPSLEDNLPNVLIESMACGTPCVSFDVGGVPEIVQHMETGYLARYKDVEDLAYGIKLLFEDSALREKLGKQGRKIVEQEYTLELQAKRYVELYQQLIEQYRE